MSSTDYEDCEKGEEPPKKCTSCPFFEGIIVVCLLLIVWAIAPRGTSVQTTEAWPGWEAWEAETSTMTSTMIDARLVELGLAERYDMTGYQCDSVCRIPYTDVLGGTNHPLGDFCHTGWSKRCQSRGLCSDTGTCDEFTTTPCNSHLDCRVQHKNRQGLMQMCIAFDAFAPANVCNSTMGHAGVCATGVFSVDREGFCLEDLADDAANFDLYAPGCGSLGSGMVFSNVVMCEPPVCADASTAVCAPGVCNRETLCGEV